jgi:Uma2 family endonuclease
MFAREYTERMVARPQTEPVPYRWTVEAFERLAELGVLSPTDARLELLEGEIVQMPPIGPDHANAVGDLTALFARYLDRSRLWVQNPVRLSPFSEPVPDLALLRPPRSRYDGRLPGAEDLLLVVEVADSTLAYDRGRKAFAYAAAGVEEYWLLNLRGGALEVHRDPAEGAYRFRRVLERFEAFAPLAFPDEPVEWWT